MFLLSPLRCRCHHNLLKCVLMVIQIYVSVATGTILVEIIDNGCGIADLDSIVQFFSSSTSSSDTSATDNNASTASTDNLSRQHAPSIHRSGCSSTGCKSGQRSKKGRREKKLKSKDESRHIKFKGQYGVGLTTCLLYSQLNTHQQLR